MALTLKEELDKRYAKITNCIAMAETYKAFAIQDGLNNTSIENLNKVANSFTNTKNIIFEELKTLEDLKLAEPMFAIIGESDMTIEVIEKLEDIYIKLHKLILECLSLVILAIVRKSE